MMEPTLIHSTITKGWLSTCFLKIWFFEELNIVGKEVFMKNFFAIERTVHLIGGTEQARLEARELLNEFCEIS
jgi:hypothetical protein